MGFPDNRYNGGVGGETSSDVLVRYNLYRFFAPWIQMIWVGQNWNSDTQTKADIAAMVNATTHGRYLVVSTLNDGNAASGQGPAGSRYLQIVSLNNDLRALYGAKFYDLRAALVAYGVGIADSQSTTYDAPPHSFQPTDVHMNSAGYSWIMSALRQKMIDLGYISDDVMRDQIRLAGGT